MYLKCLQFVIFDGKNVKKLLFPNEGLMNITNVSKRVVKTSKTIREKGSLIGDQYLKNGYYA